MSNVKVATIIPFDVIENGILPRLPVKSLVRFKAVSKQWKATISDPGFAETHRSQSKNNSNNLFAWELNGRLLYVFELKGDKFRLVSNTTFPLKERCGVYCHCDGLFLKPSLGDKMMPFILFNLSNGTYKKFHCPHRIDFRLNNRQLQSGVDAKALYGMCYDPVTKDYKVVIADLRHYAVFHCRSNKWGEMKEFRRGGIYQVICFRGACFNQTIYWFVATKKGKGEEGEALSRRIEILSFDGKEEKFNKLVQLHHPIVDPACFREPNGHLCAFPMMVYASPKEFSPIPMIIYSGPTEFRVLKKGGGGGEEWTNLKTEVPCADTWPSRYTPLCFKNDNEILFDVSDSQYYLLYNISTKSLLPIYKINAPIERMYPRVYPYQENLFSLF